MSKLEKITNDYKSIESINDLKKRKLTMAELHSISNILYGFHTGIKVCRNVIQEAVAKYFESFGFKLNYHQGRWDIAI